jgi:hypothetical protein
VKRSEVEWSEVKRSEVEWSEVKIGGLVNVFVLFVVTGCIVYVLALVVSFIVVFLYCVCV